MLSAVHTATTSLNDKRLPTTTMATAAMGSYPPQHEEFDLSFRKVRQGPNVTLGPCDL